MIKLKSLPQKLSIAIKDPVIIAFVLPWLYWIYLAHTTTMYIRYDALGYQNLATTIYQQGWIEFFKAEPIKVPLYPFLISLSMRIADFYSISFLHIQTVLQILFLLTTQFLLYKMLVKLNITKMLIISCMLYFGFSPSILNSALSLFCEIITYPFILGIIFLSVQSWKIIQENKWHKIFLAGLSLAILFVLMTSVRAVYEYVLIIFLFAYLCLSIRFLIKKPRRYFLNTLSLIITTFIIFHLSLLPYKLMNLKYNGHKALVIKGASALYANAAGRTRDLTVNNFLTALAHVPGEGVCKRVFGDEECSFWWDDKQHMLGLREKKMLREQGVPNDKLDSILIDHSIREIFSKPLQYTVLTIAEGCKMLFWESTKIGFVIYPSWLQKIFDFTPFKNGLRLLVSLLTTLSLFLATTHVFKNKQRLFQPKKRDDSIIILFFSLVIIFANIILHSFFTMATRYALPIAPLYLICIAYSAQKIFFKKSQFL